MRVKRGVTARAKHKKILKLAKGMQATRRSSYRMAKQAVIKALQYAYRDRRNKKRDLRGTWITRINAAARENGITYSQLIDNMKKKNIDLDRKILAELAVSAPKTFGAIVKTAADTK
ncbi:MAG TPA: 50S ribosomal protein L20 [Patescibacteria group bacterium]|jgi:large subunit ribosomal protein L20|nr:50S ribosomal protein L20 [Patescibacteria group bacterium]